MGLLGRGCSHCLQVIDGLTGCSCEASKALWCGFGEQDTCYNINLTATGATCAAGQAPLSAACCTPVHDVFVWLCLMGTACCCLCHRGVICHLLLDLPPPAAASPCCCCFSLLLLLLPACLVVEIGLRDSLDGSKQVALAIRDAPGAGLVMWAESAAGIVELERAYTRSASLDGEAHARSHARSHARWHEGFVQSNKCSRYSL
jgi:hypothetical protein